MDRTDETWQTRWTRRLALSLLVALVWVSLAGAVRAEDVTPSGTGSAQEPNFFWQILTNIFDSKKLLEVLEKPQFMVLSFVALNVIVFTETGLLVGFFLPGDSLLVTAGIVAWGSGWNLPVLLTTLCLSAIIGDSVGYSIGYKTGPKIFNREKSLFFHKDHLLKAQEFYVAHGGKTIILARFMPIIRTFAPVVAGVGKMNYRQFLFFNVIGGIGWVVSMVLVGYFLESVIDPPFKAMLNNDEFTVRKHLEKVVIIVVFLSISPGLFMWLKQKLKGKKVQPESQPEMANSSIP